MTLNVDSEFTRHVFDDVVHDPLHLSVDTICVGGTVDPVVIDGSQTATSAFFIFSDSPSFTVCRAN